MPLVHRQIEPVRINRTHVDTKDQFDLNIVSNNALTSLMKQMSSLVQHAEDMFNGLSEECRTVLYRAERLQSKVTVLTSNVGKLDAKTVIVRK
ncbi:hypothetical protein CAPTEDRAFT_95562 [Capitella teleta]|uniref:Wiskott-Aldrich syndrome protein family member n=1 Tax=Capitella teleta TaxID=283909 RepID=R7T659_CAPTE|nr:hypothetical protein CAPTEDRAFT_95562 [Capitella teleta]|eukprot:ELT89009.1 hypothetical protein CAPTEDRAFT_95562 [Capitella teleta]